MALTMSTDDVVTLVCGWADGMDVGMEQEHPLVAARAAVLGLRARAAEVERERSIERDAAEKFIEALRAEHATAFAATQAERDEVRAALEQAASCGNKLCSVCAAVVAKAIARPVGSVEALRSLLERAVENGRVLGGHTFGCQSTPELKAAWDEATAAIVARLLEPRSDTPEADKKGAGDA